MLDLALLTIVLGLDAFYLETAAAAGEKAYAQLQRLRTSGNAWMVWGSARKARFSIRDWPWLGGIGPIAWRQMVTALRSLKGLLLTLIPIGVLMLMPMFLATAAARARPDAPPIGPILVLAVTFFGTLPQLGFDFRGDLDRMDVLKTLPITPWRLAVGQLLTPVILVSLLQLILLVILELVGGRHLWVLGVGLLFVIPVNFLAFASENLTFLWFPIRTAAAAPGEFFQFMGRAMLLYALKMLILTMFGLAVFMVGFLAFSLAGQSWGAAFGAAWLTITGGCIAFIPALAHAFHRFDVARDTPA